MGLALIVKHAELRRVRLPFTWRAVEIIERVSDLVAHDVRGRGRLGADHDLALAVRARAGVPRGPAARQRDAPQRGHVIEFRYPARPDEDRVEAVGQPFLDPLGKFGEPVHRLDHLRRRRCGRVPLAPQDALDRAAVPAAVRGERVFARMRGREGQPGSQGRSGGPQGRSATAVRLPRHPRRDAGELRRPRIGLPLAVTRRVRRGRPGHLVPMRPVDGGAGGSRRRPRHLAEFDRGRVLRRLADSRPSRPGTFRRRSGPAGSRGWPYRPARRRRGIGCERRSRGRVAGCS